MSSQKTKAPLKKPKGDPADVPPLLISFPRIVHKSNSQKFRFGFTASSLRPELAGIVAAQFLATGSWSESKTAILRGNALQSRAPSSAIRMEREIRQRLQTLTPAELSLLTHATTDLRVGVSWLAAVKNSSFLYEFAAGPLRSKLEIHDPILRSSDYERFVEGLIPDHPEIETLRPSTAAKIRRVLLLMLREAQILKSGSEFGEISRPIISTDLLQAIREDNPRWLAAFLVPDDEIRSLGGVR